MVRRGHTVLSIAEGVTLDPKYGLRLHDASMIIRAEITMFLSSMDAITTCLLKGPNESEAHPCFGTSRRGKLRNPWPSQAIAVCLPSRNLVLGHVVCRLLSLHIVLFNRRKRGFDIQEQNAVESTESPTLQPQGMVLYIPFLIYFSFVVSMSHSLVVTVLVSFPALLFLLIAQKSAHLGCTWLEIASATSLRP